MPENDFYAALRVLQDAGLLHALTALDAIYRIQPSRRLRPTASRLPILRSTLEERRKLGYTPQQ